VYVACLLAAAACGGQDAPQLVTTSTSGSAAAADSLEFRAVLNACPEAFGGTTSSCLPGALGTVMRPAPGADPVTYIVGPPLVDGSAVETAQADQPSGDHWVVRLTFREGTDGIDAFNRAAATCSAHSSTCPTGQLAIVVDGEVVSAPTIATASFERDEIQISGAFDEQSARELASRLAG
jgi:preprotein translocase subunit SecD